MKKIKIGAVSYLNTLPLIEGLNDSDSFSILRLPPSKLDKKLEDGSVDIALCSLVDYSRLWPEVKIIPVGAIGCCGPTLTVRLFSKIDVKEIKSIAIDSDTHTSVKLLKLWLRCCHGVIPKFFTINLKENEISKKNVDAVLMIGDKVITSPPSLEYQKYVIDLGEAWFKWQSLPFVFAVWLSRTDVDPLLIKRVTMLLDRQRRRNETRLDWLAFQGSAEHKWPVTLAKKYFQEYLNFKFEKSEQKGAFHFLKLLRDHGIDPNYKEEMAI